RQGPPKASILSGGNFSGHVPHLHAIEPAVHGQFRIDTAWVEAASLRYNVTLRRCESEEDRRKITHPRPNSWAVSRPVRCAGQRDPTPRQVGTQDGRFGLEELDLLDQGAVDEASEQPDQRLGQPGVHAGSPTVKGHQGNTGSWLPVQRGGGGNTRFRRP